MSRPFGYGPSPTGWRSTKLRSILARTKRVGRPDLPLLSVNLPSGVVLRPDDSGRPAASEDLSGYQHVAPGDLVMNQLGKPHGALGVSPHEGIISPAYFVAAISPAAEPRFIHHLLRTRLYISEYERRGKYMPPNQFDISWDQFRDVELMLPPLVIQRAIADYLDTETARIDALIAKKQRMIELLEERQAANRDAEILSVAGDSTCSLRWLLREAISDGPHETPEFVDDGVPFLSVDSIVDSRVRFDGCRMISEQDHVRYCRKLRPGYGDVLITKAASVGKVALVADRREFNVWSPIAVLRTDQSVLLPEFLWQYLRTRMAQRELSLGSTSNTQQNISMRDLGSLQVPVVPIEAQRAVCERLRTESRELLAAINASVAVLLEHRQALITAAVTGELEVPGVAA